MTPEGVATDFPLKHYQRETLLRLEAYLRRIRTDGARAAFAALTNTPYTPAPFVDADMPYVCLRVPTGGGKTIIAAHAVGVAAREHLQTDAPMVLWLGSGLISLQSRCGGRRA
jgi:type III restriction enzyme